MATIIKTLKPHITRYISEMEFDEIVINTIKSYAEADLQFYQSVLAQNNFGITQSQVSNYIKFLTDRRLKLLGYSPIYGVEENPFEEIDRLYGYLESHVNEGKKEAFFETKSSAYVSADLDENVIQNWEF
jgi:ribonucleotide reductase beta subunit family protein with ferritin-like domain